MRIKLSLRPAAPNPRVPINYAYPLSAAIYKILRQASPAYADFLHQKGYEAPSGRLLKLFTFSKLWIPGVRRHGTTLTGREGLWHLQIGSPLEEEFVQHFVLGLFESSEVAIGGQGVHAVFRVELVEALPMPAFSDRMRFKCLSPITASTMRESDGRAKTYYYRPGDAGLSEALRQNLLQKYATIHGQPPTGDRLRFRLEATDRPKSRLIKIKEGTPQETDVPCFESYFTLEGSPELMRVAWECGLGEHNSQGFGMVEAV